MGNKPGELEEFRQFLKLEQAEFRLGTALSSILKGISQKARENNMSYNCDRLSDFPDILSGSPKHIEMILNNLAGHVFLQNGKNIHFKIREISGNDSEVLIQFSFSHLGAGFTHQDLLEIINAPLLVNASQSPPPLSIATYLVRQLGGQYWVDNTPGHGGSFHFKLRLGRVASSNIIFNNAKGPGRQSSGNKSPSRQVLLIEDNNIDQKLAKGILNKHDFEVHLATALDKGLFRFKTHAYQTVLVGCESDWPSLRKFYEEIKATSPEKEPYLLICSPINPLPKNIPSTLHWLPKPIKANSLVNLLSSIINSP